MVKIAKNNNNSALEKFCLSVIKWGTYLALFTPLVVAKDSFFPFVTPKTIYFRVLVEIIFAAYLILAVLAPEYRPRFNFLSISIILFVAVLILTAVLGINPERSFWSTYERMTGLFTFFHLLAFFLILSNVYKTRLEWNKILSVSILVGVLLSVYVVSSNQISSRGGGTVGNTSFMAAYLLFDIFFALILFLEKRNSGWRIFSALSLIIMIAILMTSTARGAIISFFGGLLFMWLGYLIFSGKKKLKIAGILITLFLICLSVFLLVYQPGPVKGVIEMTMLEMKPRFVVWESAWKGFLERPIFGWGPENFNTVFTRFFNPCMFLSECGSEIWFDRVHNIVFDTLLTTGVVGFLSYILIFIAAFVGLLKAVLKDKDLIFASLGVAVLLAVYFFQNLLVFDMISSYTVFFLSLGFVSFLINQNKDSDFTVKEEKTSMVNNLFQKKAVRVLLSVVILLSTGLLLYFGNIQTYQTAIATVNMITSEDTLDKIIDYQEQALNSLMEKYEPREQFAQRLYTIDPAIIDDRETLVAAFNLAESQMQESMKKNYLDFRPHLFSGRLYFSDYRYIQESQKLDLAQQTIEKAIELSPTNQQGYWFLGDVKLNQGQVEESIVLFQKAIDLEPRLAISHWYLAMIYKMTNSYEKALEKVKDAQKNGYELKNSLSDIDKVAEIYDTLQDDSGLVSLYLAAIERYPEEPQLWAGLAAAYANLGDLAKSKQAAEKVIEINPDLRPQVEQFLQEISQ